MKVLGKGEYYGTMQSEYKIDGIVLSEYDYLIARTDWHYHENPYLMYVLAGNLYDVNKKEKTNCSTGSLLLHNWQEPHLNAKDSSYARGFHIEFESSWFDNRKLDIKLWEGSQHIEHPKLHHLLAKLYAEFKIQDAYSQLSIETLLFQMCENIGNDPSIDNTEEPTWIHRLKEILHHDTESINLQSLSHQLGVHPGHISRAVPKYLSTTLGDYIRQLKIKKAIPLLLSPQLSYADITYDCGFADQSHFIRTFRTYLGMTPKQYRSKILRC